MFTPNGPCVWLRSGICLGQQWRSAREGDGARSTLLVGTIAVTYSSHLCSLRFARGKRLDSGNNRAVVEAF